MTSQAEAKSILDALACEKSGCVCRTSAKVGHGKTHCPVHDDEHPSFSVNTKEGKVLVNCPVCNNQGKVIDALRERGLWHGTSANGKVPKVTFRQEKTVASGKNEVARWAVRGYDGKLLAYHIREEAGGRKEYPWEMPNGTRDLKGKGLHPSDMLYGLELIAGAKRKRAVIVEGEKAADALRKVLGDYAVVLATVTGASGVPSDGVLTHMEGWQVWLWRDNDVPGIGHMDKICQRLRSLGAATVRYVAWREAPIRGDAYDYLQAHDRKELIKLLNEATSNPPEIFSAAALMKMSLPEPRWTVRNVLPEGLAMLGSKPKLGKSCLGLGLGIAVADGGRALGKITVESGDVLYLALEDTQSRLQERLGRLLGDKPVPARLEFAVDWPKLDDGGLLKLESWLQCHPEARLIVIDVWKRVRQTRKQGASIYDEDYEHLIELKALADRYRVTILVLHHTRKARADDVIDEISGSGGVAGALDTILVLHRSRGEADAELWITGRLVEESHKALKFDSEIWTLLGDAEEVVKSDQRKQVLDAIKTLSAQIGRGVKPAEVAAMLDWDQNRVRVRIFHMVNDGELQRHPDGTYTHLSVMGNGGNGGGNGNERNGRNGGGNDRKPLRPLPITRTQRGAGSTHALRVKLPKRRTKG